MTALTEAWRKYRDEHCVNWTPRDTDREHTGFINGWAACMRAARKADDAEISR
jgi:hypothetical protein